MLGQKGEQEKAPEQNENRAKESRRE